MKQWKKLRRSPRRRVSDSRNARARIVRLFISVAFLFLALISLQLQVFESSEYRLHSDRNRLRKISIPAPRGLITDRNGKLLAENIPSYSLYLIPSHGESTDEVLRRLADVLTLNEGRMAELKKRLSQNTFRPVKVADNVDIAVRSFLEEHGGLIPGLLFRSEPLRYYRYGRELSHLIGYVGETTASDRDIASDVASEKWDFVGRDGVELIYEDILRGRPGAYFIEVDARGREIGAFRGKDPLQPQRGLDVELTIDLDLQLEAYRLFPKERKGVILCMDPANGNILAMVSRPDYDPNTLVAGISRSKWRAMVNDPGSPFFNRVSQAGYPPGSTFKPAVALMALEKGIVDLNFKQPLPCLGGLQFGNRWFRCWKEEGHGTLDLYQAIVQSCDVYFYQLGNRIGLKNLLDGAKTLGFASATGIDLPNEAMGFVPDIGWYDQRYGKAGWGKGVALNLAIGQGEILTTPLQLGVFFSMIANGGHFVRPRVVRGADNSAGEQRHGLSPDVIEPLRKALEGVVADEKGTGRYAGRITGMEMAGKTGTAQNPHGADHSVFVGYAPVATPELLIVAIVEGAGHGSSVAAPLVGELLKFYVHGNEEEGMSGSVVEGAG